MRRSVLALVLLVGALGGGCGLGGGDGDTRAREATGPTTATAPSTTPTPTTPAPRAAGPSVQELVERAAELRGLELGRPVRVRELDRADLAALLRRLLARDPDPTLSAGWNDALHLLGVLEPGTTLRGVLEKQLNTQVGGLYDPRTGRLYVVRSRGGSLPRSVVVHEAVHALQDRAFDLEGGLLSPRPADADAQGAAQALVEGDATEVQLRYFEDAGFGAILGEALGAITELLGARDGDTPPYLERSLVFPYEAGLGFVSALRERGGQRLVDRAFRRPPRTTAAILDPGRYLRGDPPAAPVELPRPRRGWRRTLSTTWGAAELVNLTGDGDLAGLWRGGRLAVDARGPKRRLVLRIAAASPRRVADALRDDLPRTARVRAVRDEVRVSATG